MKTHALSRAACSAVALSVILSLHAKAESGGDGAQIRQPAPTANVQVASAPPLETERGSSAVERAARRALASEPGAGEARIDKLPVSAHTGVGGSIMVQTDGVRISCFPEALRGALRQISTHFGRPVVVTSGLRGGGRRGSYHKRCMAADIQIAGVSPGAIARFARKMDGVGGVGTYGHTRSVHVDVGERVFSWHGSRRRNAALGSGCCPTCAAMEAAATGRRFEAVCTG